MHDPASSRRGLLKYAAATGVGVSTTAGVATYLHSGRRGGSEDQRHRHGLLLTWQRDPTTTMTIDWHGLEPRDGEAALEYRRSDQADWTRETGTTRPFPHSPRRIHRLELTDLSPDTEYAFRLPAFAEEYTFRTMPATVSADRPVSFATGGDTMQSWKHLHRMNDAIALQDVDFVHWGGDLAYADANPNNIVAWYDWFAVNKHSLVTPEGRVIPLVAEIGNHEVSSFYYHEDENYEQTATRRRALAPFFYELFAFPGQPGYGALDFGDYLRLLVLDSNHTNPIAGTQTEWLAARLAEPSPTHVVPSYHVPAYPSNRDPSNRNSRAIRAEWTPLFDANGVEIALEHHDHVYKRSVPIRNNEPAEDGIIYAGDGAWGVETREGDQRDQWYIDHMVLERHGKLVHLDEDGLAIEVISERGETIDAFEV
ncbi:MAG: metallophosphoesterase family protein [Natrialbaceae archaeon]|nr:metallophosphoesterase family protein [Natrialbaceae archaeon]